jgi:hypothetical protein
MEKVIIKSVVNSGKTYKDKPIVLVELEDGRKGSAFNADALNWKGEMELDIKEGKEYQGVMQYYFNVPGSGENKTFKGTPKDWTYEKRKTSLECALKMHDTPMDKNYETVLETAEKFYDYLNKK